MGGQEIILFASGPGMEDSSIMVGPEIRNFAMPLAQSVASAHL